METVLTRCSRCGNEVACHEALTREVKVPNAMYDADTLRKFRIFEYHGMLFWHKDTCCFDPPSRPGLLHEYINMEDK